jgi:Fe-S-cluster containining protein
MREMKKSISTKLVQIERRSRLSRKEFSEKVDYWMKKIWEPAQKEQIPIEKLAGKIENSFLAPKDAPIPDCRTCGLCCAILPAVQLTGDDLTSPEHFWEITIEGQAGEQVVDRVLRRNSKTGSCLALSGEVGKIAKCEIYDERPQPCRALEAGSDACRSLRRTFNLEPSLSQIETIEGLMKIFEYDASIGSARIIHSEISENAETRVCEINVQFQNDEQTLLHKFDAEKEKWLEGDFFGLTLTQAEELILSRQSI